MKKLLLALVIAFSASAANDANLDARIRGVETGLTTAVIVQGTPPAKMSIAERMRYYKVPGISVAVIHNFAIDWAKGYGVLDKESNRPVGTETLFQAGSISKPVAAVAALKLVEDGRLNLDEDVNAKLKSWKVPENEFTRDEKVTLRRILSHSAGLTIHGFPGYTPGEPVPTIVQVLDGVKPANTAAVRVDILPGTRFRYSGGGFTVMQLLLTEVTAKSFPDLMKQMVLDKIGMAHSTYQQPLPPKLLATAAAGYRSNGAEVKGQRNTYPEMAAAGLWTTASDLARFAIEIQKSREGKANHVLSQSMVNQMLTVQKEPYGLGLSLEGRGPARRFGHGGADEGFQAMLLATVEGGDGAVVMTNSDSGSRLAQEILYSVAAEYGWPEYKPAERTAVKLDAKALQAFAGKYDAGRNGLATCSVQGDHLELGIDDDPPLAFYPESEDTFFPLTMGFPRIRFSKDPSGKVTEVVLGLQGNGLHAKRVQ